MSRAIGLTGLIDIPPEVLRGSGAPPENYSGKLGQIYVDVSSDPKSVYIYNGDSWVTNQVELSTDATFAGALDTTASSSLAIKTYVDSVAIAGAPIATESVYGISEVATNAEAVAGTPNNPGVTARFVTPSNLAAVFASPPALGSTSASTGAFSTLTASGAFSLTGDTVQITEGGTGASSAGAARTALGVAIGTDVQAHDDGLDDIAGLALTDGNIIVGDGTNWVAESGATARTSLGLAIGSDVQAWDQALEDVSNAAVTDGNILVGDGSNWVAESGATARTSLGLGSIATQDADDVAITGGSITGVAGFTEVATVTVSTAELLALATSPKVLVAAPGADQFIEFVSAQLILDYNSIAYTESGDNMVVRYTDESGVILSQTIESTGFIDQTADTITNALPKIDAIVSAAGSVDQAIVLHNTGDNFGAGNSPVRVKIVYRVHEAGL